MRGDILVLISFVSKPNTPTHQVQGDVIIELFKAGTKLLTILDGSYPIRMDYDAERQRYTGSMKFQVPPTARVGSDYRVRIASTKYVNVSSFSEYFHIIGDSRGVKGGVFVDSREFMNAQNVQVEENDEDRLFRLLVEQEEQEEKIRAIHKKVRVLRENLVPSSKAHET